MTKKILGMALFAAMMAVAPAAAQVKDSSACDTVRTCDKNKSFNKGDKDCALNGKCDLYKGITLTENQKTQLQELDRRQRDEGRQMKKEARELKRAEKEQARADRKERKEAMEAKKRAYLNEVKQILGPENYVVFLENFYVTVPSMKDGRGPKKMDRQGKMAKIDRQGKMARIDRPANNKIAQSQVK